MSISSLNKPDKLDDKNNDYYTLKSLESLKKNIKEDNPFYNDKWKISLRDYDSNCKENLVITRKSKFLDDFIDKKFKIVTVSSPPNTSTATTTATTTSTTPTPTSTTTTPTDKYKYENFITENQFKFGLNIGVDSDYHPVNWIKNKTSSINPLANDKKWNTYTNGINLRDKICLKIVEFYKNYIELLNDFITLYKIALNNRLDNIFYNRCSSVPRNIALKNRIAYYDNTQPNKLKTTFEKNLFNNLSNSLKDLLNTEDTNTELNEKLNKYKVIKNLLIRPFDVKDPNNCYIPFTRKSFKTLNTLKDERWITGYSNLSDSELIPDVLSTKEYTNQYKNATALNTNSVINADNLNIQQIYKLEDRKNNKDKINEQINYLINKYVFEGRENNKLIYKDLQSDIKTFTETNTTSGSAPVCANFIRHGTKLLNNNITWINLSKFFVNQYNGLIKLLDGQTTQIIDNSNKEKYLSDDDIKKIRIKLQEIILQELNNENLQNLVNTNLDEKGINTLKNTDLNTLSRTITKIEKSQLGIVALEVLFSHFINNKEYSLKKTQDDLLDVFMNKCVSDPSKIAEYKIDKFINLFNEYVNYLKSGFIKDVCRVSDFNANSALRKLNTKKIQLINFILDPKFLEIFQFNLDSADTEINYKINFSSNKIEKFKLIADEILKTSIFNEYFNKNIKEDKYKLLDDTFKNDTLGNNRYSSLDDLQFYPATFDKKINTEEHNTKIMSFIYSIFNKKNFGLTYNNEPAAIECKWLTKISDNLRIKILSKINEKVIKESYIDKIVELMSKLILYSIFSTKIEDKNEFINKLHALEERLTGNEVEPNPVKDFRLYIKEVNDGSVPKPTEYTKDNKTRKTTNYSNAITVAWETPDSKPKSSKVINYTLTITDDTDSSKTKSITIPSDKNKYNYKQFDNSNNNEYTFYTCGNNTDFIEGNKDYTITIVGNTAVGSQSKPSEITVKTNAVGNNYKEKPKFEPNLKVERVAYDKIKINWEKADKVVHIPIEKYIIKLLDNTPSTKSTTATVLAKYDVDASTQKELNHDTSYELEFSPNINELTLIEVKPEINLKILLYAKNIIGEISDITTENDYKAEIVIPEYKPDAPTLSAGSTKNTKDTIFFKIEPPLVLDEKNKFIKKFEVYLYDEKRTAITITDPSNPTATIDFKKTIDYDSKNTVNLENISISNTEYTNLLEQNKKYIIKAKSILDDTNPSSKLESKESDALDLFTALELPDNIEFKTQIHDTKIIIEFVPDSFINYNLNFTNDTKFEIELSSTDTTSPIPLPTQYYFTNFGSSSPYKKFEETINGLIPEKPYTLKIKLETKDIENKQYIKEIYTKEFTTPATGTVMPTTFTGGAYRKYVLRRSSKSNKNRISISPKSLKKISKKSPKQYRKVFDQYYGSK